MDNLITYLCNYAFDHDIGYQLDKNSYDPEDASFYLNLTNTVYINMNYKNEKEIPFQFAHEISHALNGDKGSNSFCSNVFYIREECAANRRAVAILLEYCELNNLTYSDSIDFMLAFGIPLKVGYVVDEVFKERFGVQYSETYCEM